MEFGGADLGDERLSRRLERIRQVVPCRSDLRKIKSGLFIALNFWMR